MKQFIPAILILIFLSHCRPNVDAQYVVDKAIEASGGNKYEKMKASFDFRGRHYTITRSNGLFQYTRQFQDSLGMVVDYLTNETFYREINGNKVKLSDERSNAFRNSVNSVIYFALLPYGLNDPAVKKELLGEKEINNKRYYKIRVSFHPDGGGDDFQDKYIYWFDKNDFSMDYFAYVFFDEQGGIRFREAKNTRNVNGLVFSDYDNYSSDNTKYPIEEIDKLFLDNRLKLLSSIEVKNIQVND